MNFRALAAHTTVIAVTWTSPAAAQNAIVTENALPGTSDWDFTPTASRRVEGYASEASAAPGGAFHLHVSAGGRAGDRYRVLVYRLGWYDGMGGRLVTCLPGCDSDEPYVPQPRPPAPNRGSGLVRAAWSTTDVVRVGRRWVTGYYLAEVRVTAGPDKGAVGRIPLVVRARPNDAAAILVQVPVNTWQAYNPWGGKSLYTYNSTDNVAADKVSFDRPYSEDVLVPVPFGLELQAVRYLEREGYDLGYVTDVDVDRSPRTLMHHRLVMSIGHDEYWSVRQRDAFERALGLATNLAALGANAAYWRIGYEDGHRTMARVELFRSLRPRRPECRLWGVMYAFNAQRPPGSPPTAYDLAAPASDPWIRGTGIRRRDDIPGVVGYEWDTLSPGCFPGRVTRVLHAEPRGEDRKVHPADAVRGVAYSGARVFASGSLQFSWALDGYGNHLVSQRVQVLMRNALRDLTRPAPPRPVTVKIGRSGVAVHAGTGLDPRVRRIAIYVQSGSRITLLCRNKSGSCRDKLRRGTVRYSARAVDRWGTSARAYSQRVAGRR